MIRQLIIGSIIIAVAVAIQAEMFAAFSRRFENVVLFCRRFLRRFANTGAITIAVLYIMLVHAVSVWLWAIVFLVVGAFAELEPALYFSMVSVTTVGFGDVVLTPEWRLLSGMAAANGFLTFGWSAAYMVDLVRRTA